MSVFTAHPFKDGLEDIAWHPSDRNQLTTCSYDKTLKVTYSARHPLRFACHLSVAGDKAAGQLTLLPATNKAGRSRLSRRRFKADPVRRSRKGGRIAESTRAPARLETNQFSRFRAWLVLLLLVDF